MTALAPSTNDAVLSTLNPDGTRRWLRPRPSAGRFVTRRRTVAYLLILIFTVLPYMHVGGRPLILLDIAHRRFTILGATFLPTDTVLLALLMVSIFVAVFLVTALFGRVWCGWACPQTVYMEFVFRPIERFFEGTPGSRRRGFLGRTRLGKPLKYAAYAVVSAYLAHTFLAYFVGVEALAVWVRRSPLEHPVSFLVMATTTGLMLLDFCWFREQTCIVACPYGRFQSVMLDRESLIVTYDGARGEPRRKVGRSALRADPGLARSALRADPGSADAADRPVADEAIGIVSLAVLTPPRIGSESRSTRGDCVDCGLCVATCPTGIDIRDGLQLECIGCAQCIDACDAVMTKLKRPRGLIRYSSQAAVAGRPPRIVRARLVIYSIILTVLLAALALKLATRSPADVTVLRGLGAPFVLLDAGEVGNQVRVKIVNRTPAPVSYAIDAVGADGLRIRSERNPVTVAPGEAVTVPAMIVAPADSFSAGALRIAVRVRDGAGFEKDRPYRLLGPASPRPAGASQETER